MDFSKAGTNDFKIENLSIDTSEIKCNKCKDTGYIFNKETYSAIKCTCLVERQKSALPSLYANKTFKDMDLSGYKNKENVKQVIEVIKKTNPYELKKGLYIQGDVGRGKTLLVACIFNHFINSVSVKFVKVGDLMYKAREMFNGGEFDINIYKEIDILILDDFGVEKTTEFAEDILLNIIEYRYERQKPTYITSNIPANKIIEMYPKHGRRLESRFIGENAMCMLLTLHGKDYRK